MFDAYGTLFDVHSIAALAEELAPRQGAVLSQIWRTKQLEYTWLQSLMISPTRPRDDFAALTAHALDYAIAQLMVPLGAADRQRLLDAYRLLAPFPDALDALAATRTASALDPVERHAPDARAAGSVVGSRGAP